MLSNITVEANKNLFQYELIVIFILFFHKNDYRDFVIKDPNIASWHLSNYYSISHLELALYDF